MTSIHNSEEIGRMNARRTYFQFMMSNILLVRLLIILRQMASSSFFFSNKNLTWIISINNSPKQMIYLTLPSIKKTLLHL